MGKCITLWAAAATQDEIEVELRRKDFEKKKAEMLRALDAVCAPPVKLT